MHIFDLFLILKILIFEYFLILIDRIVVFFQNHLIISLFFQTVETHLINLKKIIFNKCLRKIYQEDSEFWTTTKEESKRKCWALIKYYPVLNSSLRLPGPLTSETTLTIKWLLIIGSTKTDSTMKGKVTLERPKYTWPTLWPWEECWQSGDWWLWLSSEDSRDGRDTIETLIWK